MTSRELERWLMPRLFALFLVAAACTTALPPHATLAQPSQVTIRGFRFDPADVQDASAEYLRNLGIEDGLQARAPARNDGPHWRLLSTAGVLMKPPAPTSRTRLAV